MGNGRSGIGARSSPNDVIKNESGNVAEINLLLVAALRERGLNANPIISSTRDNGIIMEAFPTIDRFNYVLAAVKKADASIFFSMPPNQLPLSECFPKGQ